MRKIAVVLTEVDLTRLLQRARIIEDTHRVVGMEIEGSILTAHTTEGAGTPIPRSYPYRALLQDHFPQSTILAAIVNPISGNVHLHVVSISDKRILTKGAKLPGNPNIPLPALPFSMWAHNAPMLTRPATAAILKAPDPENAVEADGTPDPHPTSVIDYLGGK